MINIYLYYIFLKNVENIDLTRPALFLFSVWSSVSNIALHLITCVALCFVMHTSICDISDSLEICF